jgi:tetratricopeptide (TPR) repeat protein
MKVLAGSSGSGELEEAADLYARDRYSAAQAVLRRVLRRDPESVEAIELMGLCHYRMGNWLAAIRELEVVAELTGSVSQHPVIADCYRALRRWRKVESVIEEARRASPDPDIQVELKLVKAGSLADQGRLREAIEVLEPPPKAKNPSLRQIRWWYALADLYERAGDVVRARALFSRIVTADPHAYDARSRLSACS